MKKLTKLTALVLFTFLAAVTVRADVIWQELFTYAGQPGLITNISGTVPTANWILHSGTGADAFCTGNQEQVSTTGTSGNGINGKAPSRQDDVHRNFAPGSSNSSLTNAQQVIYASLVVNFTNIPSTNGTYFASYYVGSTTFECKLYALQGNPGQPTNNFAVVSGNCFRLGVVAGGTGNQAPAASAIFPVDLALNTPYQVVLGWNPTANPASDGNLGGFNEDAVTLWVNPISPSDTQAISGDTFTPGVANIANAFALRQATAFGGYLTVSNIVIATTFNEAFTNGAVGSTNAVAPVIVYQPAALTTNFQNDSGVTLFGVANGQGLGSMTYKWQVSSSPANTSPADVPSANANVLSVPTGTLGNFYYTLVATTPYGLSVTSSVAKVAILTPAGPPSFTAQPVSQTVYKGATATLTTTVLSPGTVSYTWYSNNVIVTAGQMDSGLSSSYVLPNAQTNFSATYKVAVTNSTTINGIVSTNAVLTVLNATNVTIAYLRSLVDPGNGFNPINPPGVPYQISGTVTTFTNITTGNTSSYYLQDGTAGIDIFVSGDSNFRPAQGQQITFVGVLSGFTTGLELYADVADSSYPYTYYFTNNPALAPLPTPITIPYNVLNQNNITNVNLTIAESLVTLCDVYFGTNAGAVITNHIVTVTNSAGQSFRIQTFALDLDTQGDPQGSATFPTHASSVTGVLYGINTNFTVGVTRLADIVTAPSSPTSIAINTNSVLRSGNNFTLNWTASPAGACYNYTVWRAPTLGANGPPAWTILQSGITGTSYLDTSATAGTGFYRVTSP